ncbi:MAG: sigma-54-dependent Fis family transcriptional regulator [Acidobacteriota bacterium]|nr:sigma-54-dependent Fis family transcriptional regulator [Blastocatellia bacterium]MDW8411110.1 sigma-54-dependent Fis family transcriptional regulator [Acidobacteriota bacterium]
MIAEAISLERKLQMYEARERILNRINPEINTAIDLDKFLQGTVNELGKMMQVDRCDVMVFRKDSELKIDFEYRAHPDIPSSVGLIIPVDFQRLSSSIKLTAPIAIEDTEAPGRDPLFRHLARTLQTRSLLVMPIILSNELLGLLGFHQCTATRRWFAEEIQFVQSIAHLIAVGYKYTRIYQEKEKEAEVNKVLLEIASDINAQHDLAAITAQTIERSLMLLKADVGFLGLLDSAEKTIHFSTVCFASEGLLQPQEKSEPLELSDYPLLRRPFIDRRTLLLSSKDDMSRFYLRKFFSGRAAMAIPVVVKDRMLGLLGLVWFEDRRPFSDFEVNLAEGIANQIAIAMEREQLSAEVMRLRGELNMQVGNTFIGSSPKVRQVIEMALNVADTNTTVLLEGESGTGKELLSSFIQANSSRHAAPFVKVNCGAIPENLMESELFGHERGAFTDARSRRIGRFEEANLGTLFLDEVAEMSPAAQVKLLRVLQDGTFTRVGGSESLKVDVRIIAATNVDLKEAIERGRFRADLYYRLNVYPIRLPALRERREDIPLLAMHFLDIYRKRTGKLISGISESALQALRLYNWPGNVRELGNAIERAVIIAKGRMITVDDLPEEVIAAADSANCRERKMLEIEVGSTDLESVEKRLIEMTLEYTKGDKTKAASILGIGRKTLYRKLERYSSSLSRV